MADIVIKEEVISKVLSDNLAEILKDVFTGYSSPVKKLFTDEDGEIYKSLKATAEKVFTQIISDGVFQEELKNKLLEVAVKNMMKN